MLTQLKANASSVPTNLGGGGHRFIGAILSPASYHTLAPLTPFIGPTHIVTLIVPPNSTQYVISLIKTQHDEAIIMYHLYLLVQQAIIQQFLDAIESKYLTCLHNRLIGQVPSIIYALIFQLLQVYGKITPKILWEQYDAVASMSYNIDEPINIIYSSIDDLCEIS